MRDSDFTGTWWLPGTTDRMVTGSLANRSDGLTLATQSGLEPLPEPVTGSFTSIFASRRHDRVFGDVGGRPATLLDLSGVVGTLPMDRPESWSVGTAVIGVHLTGPDEARFDGATLRMKHLRTWAGDPGVQQLVQFGGPGEPIRRAQAKVRARTLHTATLPWGTVRLAVEPSYRMSDGTVILGHDTLLRVSVNEPHTMEQMWATRLLPLRDMLAVSLGDAVPVERVTLTDAKAAAEDKHPVEVIFQTAEPIRSRSRTVADIDFALRRSTLPGGFKSLVKNWYGVQADHAVGVSRIVDVLHAPHMYADDRLTAYVTAMDGLATKEDRAAWKAIADSGQAAFHARVEEALAESDVLAAVMGQLKPKDPNERQRLLVLIDVLGQFGTLLSGGDPKGFAQDVVQARNFLIHPRGNRPVLEGEPLIAHIRALGWILRCVLFVRAGVTAADLPSLLADTGAPGIAENVAKARTALAAAKAAKAAAAKKRPVTTPTTAKAAKARTPEKTKKTPTTTPTPARNPDTTVTKATGTHRRGRERPR